jgi:6-phosphogluconolactonase
MYTHLAEPRVSQGVDWSRVQVFWGDERMVPPSHTDSNYRMTHSALLSKVPIPESNVHRIRGELEPSEAALQYEDVLRETFQVRADTEGGKPGFPRFDLVLLGMGGDGHTASLFPHSDAVHEEQRWVVPVYVNDLGVWRVTLSPPVLNAAAYVLFQVVGGDKAERLNEVLHGPYRADVLPAQLVQPQAGKLVWLIDEAAGALL